MAGAKSEWTLTRVERWTLTLSGPVIAVGLGLLVTVATSVSDSLSDLQKTQASRGAKLNVVSSEVRLIRKRLSSNYNEDDAREDLAPVYKRLNDHEQRLRGLERGP